MLELAKSRRSIRKYKDIAVEKEKIDTILKVASLAPTSMNKKPVEYIVVENKETLLKLKTCKTFGTSALETAPLAIVVIADTKKSDIWMEDASIAATFIQLEAETLGLGSNWIQIRNRQSDKEDSQDAVRKVLKIDESFGVLSIITIGHKDEIKQPYDEPIKDSSKIHYEEFRK